MLLLSNSHLKFHIRLYGQCKFYPLISKRISLKVGLIAVHFTVNKNAVFVSTPYSCSSKPTTYVTILKLPVNIRRSRVSLSLHKHLSKINQKEKKFISGKYKKFHPGSELGQLVRKRSFKFGEPGITSHRDHVIMTNRDLFCLSCIWRRWKSTPSSR